MVRKQWDQTHLNFIPSPRLDDRPTVKLNDLGKFVGLVDNDVDVFLGIKYAVPPLGPLRFKVMRSVSFGN